jgi:hypothetical protein
MDERAKNAEKGKGKGRGRGKGRLPRWKTTINKAEKGGDETGQDSLSGDLLTRAMAKTKDEDSRLSNVAEASPDLTKGNVAEKAKDEDSSVSHVAKDVIEDSNVPMFPSVCPDLASGEGKDAEKAKDVDSGVSNIAKVSPDLANGKGKEAEKAKDEDNTAKVSPALANGVEDNVAFDACQGYAHTCEHAGENKICVQLLDNEGTPLNWGDKGNFWDITDQMTPANLKTWHWDSETLTYTVGMTGRCIDTQLTAKLVQNVGCDNVDIRCTATQVGSLIGGPESHEGYFDLEFWRAKECVQQKCLQMHTGVAPSLRSAPVLDTVPDTDSTLAWIGYTAAGSALVALVTIAVARQRRVLPVVPDSLLG